MNLWTTIAMLLGGSALLGGGCWWASKRAWRPDAEVATGADLPSLHVLKARRNRR